MILHCIGRRRIIKLSVKVIPPIVAMRGGEDHQQYVDILIPHKATFKLIQGEGPVHLVGSHCVNFYGYR